MERPTAPARVVRVGNTDRPVTAVIAIAGIGILTAIMKPWGPGPGTAAGTSVSDPATAGRGQTAVSAQASEAPGASSYPSTNGLLLTGGEGGVVQLPGGGTLDCLEPTGWRLIVDASANGVRTRTTIAVSPVPAGGPLDPSVPVVPIVSGPVSALGFCSPEMLGTSPISWNASLWRLRRSPPGVTTAVRTAQVESPGGGIGGMARAPAPRGSTGEWAPGRYVLQLRETTTGRRDAWIAMDIAVVESP